MSPTEPNVIGIGRACRLIREEVTIGSNVSEYSSSCSARVRFVRCTRTPHNQPYRGAVLNSASSFGHRWAGIRGSTTGSLGGAA
jgi:hypothetical protein